MSNIQENSLGQLENQLASGTKKWEDYDTIVCPDGSIIDMQKLLKDQANAMAACKHIAPAFGGLISQLNFKYTFQISTQATDGFSIYANPQFTAQELDTPTKKVAVMLHEVMHCLLGHLRRGKGHDPERSNIAADYEVNSTLTEMGLIKASTWKEIHALYDQKYTNMGYETIYEKIGNQSSQQPMSNQQGANQSQQNQQGSGQQQGQGSGQSQQSQQGKGKGKSQPQQGQGQGSSQRGGQGGGQSQQSQQPQQGQEQGGGQSQQSQQPQQGQGQGSGFNDPNGTRDDPDANGKNQGKCRPQDCMGQASSQLSKIPGNAGGMISKSTGDKLSESEGYDKDTGNEDAKDSEWARKAQEAANEISKKQGLGQGWDVFVQKINSLNRVTTNWRKALKNVVGRSLNEEDKRQAFANKNVLVTQDRIARTDKDKYNALTDIIAFVDTSGSMSNNYKAACLKQVYQTAKQKKACRMIIIPFDDGPRDVLEYTSVDKLYNDIKRGKLKLKGGGGTDVRPCFKFLQTDKRFKHRIFELIMIFTDGYLQQVKRNPKICQHLCWVISDNPNWDLEYKEKNTYRVTMDQKDFKE